MTGRLYAIFWGIFSALVLIAWFNKPWRLPLLIVAAAVLGIGWVMERSRFQKKFKRAVGREIITLGTIRVDECLVVSDQLKLGNAQSLCELPLGKYSIQAEILADGRDVYIAAITLVGVEKGCQLAKIERRIVVDTGFMIFIGTTLTEK